MIMRGGDAVSELGKHDLEAKKLNVASSQH